MISHHINNSDTGTGKTHTLIELIRQLCALKPPQRILVCGASNLAVDNILERLLAIGATLGSKSDSSVPKATRIGHPARVLANSAILDVTLEARVERSDQAALAKDVRDELEVTLATLSGKGKGAKGKAPRGAERRKMWDEVKALRKE
jgi:DNA polymerase alpha-associated DNA helicase A